MPLSAPQVQASPPCPSPLPPASAALGLSPAAEEALPAAASPFLLSKGGGHGQSPVPLAHHSLDGLPDLDLDLDLKYLDAVLGDEKGDRAAGGGGRGMW